MVSYRTALVTVNQLRAGRTVVNDSAYTININDYLVGVTYTSTGVVTLTLPLVTSVPNYVYVIVDEGGNAVANNITIVANAADTIIGTTSVIISSNYNSITIYNNGSSKWFIV